MPTGLVRLEKQTVYIQTADFAFAGKFFVIFVSATLATNKLIPDQPQFKQNFELTRFKVIPPDYNVANSAPIISNFVEEIKIFEKDYKEIVVANISDDKNNERVTITIKVGCLINSSDWIDSSKSTNSQISLAMRVPAGVIDDTCTLEFTVFDNDKDAPMSLTKQVKIKVLALTYEVP